MNRFPHYTQMDRMDCGPTCLRMIAKYYGKSYSLETLRKHSQITKAGVSLLGISEAAESIGFSTSAVRITLQQLKEYVNFPCILHWNSNHFVVCYRIRKCRHGFRYYIADPGTQLLELSESDFCNCWLTSKSDEIAMGAALLLQPTPLFYKMDDEHNKVRDSKFLYRYLSPYKQQMFQLMLCMLLLSALQFVAPFLTQALVDQSIPDKDFDFIALLLIAQLTISISQVVVEFIRSWILLHVNIRINISLISDFLIKLMKLPMSFFDTKMIGDVMQRIGDHNRIENFLTGTSVTTMFSLVNFLVFGGILSYYNYGILAIFLVGNALYICWVLGFLKYRRELDANRFQQAATEQSTLVQLISGIQEIKMNNCERQKRWQWERIQVSLFKISQKGLSLSQIQQAGSVFFSQTTHILISFLAARAVIANQMTLGMMMSLTYIIGELSGPINAFIGFIQQLQDAKISLERLNEIHRLEDEELDIDLKHGTLPVTHNISINNLSFSYDGSERNLVLHNINLLIPEKKVTAIVGASGSGKTTLLKLILGFYQPNQGEIRVGAIQVSQINPHLWREKCGCVMQDGFIFSDTISNNIAIDEEHLNPERLKNALKISNTEDFVKSLPLGLQTKIGLEGNGISLGQKQRLLIARAVYKQPEFLFFDEATNALDTINEQCIMEQLHQFYKERTVVIVAHRLSTVKDADKIIVLDKGRIMEEGKHDQLVKQKGLYYQLVRKQLELGD